MKHCFVWKESSKSFPGVQALSDCKFELRSGEVHALVGENGAGKSTMMKILGGIYDKDAGHIYLDGKEVNITSPHMAQELGISIIHQELNLMPHLTVAQNIFIGREQRSKIPFVLDDKAANQETERVLDLLNLQLSPKYEGFRSDGCEATNGGNRKGAIFQRKNPRHG